MRATAVCCIGAIMLLAACENNNEPEATDTSPATAPGAAMAPGAETESAPPADASVAAQGFVDKVAASNRYEIEAARIAKDKSKSEQVRDFAEAMIDEHGKAQSQLQAAVTAAGNGLKFDPKLNPDQQAQLDALRNAAAGFDDVYVGQQRTAHEQALSLLRDYAESGTVQPLREHAQQASAVVAKHLDEVKKLPLG